MKKIIYSIAITLGLLVFFLETQNVSAQSYFVKVIQPNTSGISWSIGTTHLLSWTDNLSGKVNIYLINYETHPYDTIRIAYNRSGSTYPWRISSSLPEGRHYKIMVASKTDPSVYDKSDRYFSLVKGTVGGTIHVEQPSAGNLIWTVGTKHLISWTDNLAERVNIRLVNYETHPYDTTVIANNRSGSTYYWRIPSSTPSGRHYKVLVVSSANKNLYDRSDHYFAIQKGTAGGTIRMEQPNANGIKWSVGTKHLISWTDNLSERVNIRLVNYETHPYDTTVIANNRSGSTYVWRIPSGITPGRHYKVLVISTKNPRIYGRSRYYFSLVKGTAYATIRVEQPSVNGIVWSLGTRHLISWTDNLHERVNLKLVNYETHPYDTTVIANNRNGSTYAWRIPSGLAPGRHYKVLAVSSQNKRIYGRSRYYFSLVKGTAHGTVRVEQPSVNGIVWSAGSKHLISWTDNLSERVNIKLINYETHPYDTTTIANNRSGSTYIWRIPSGITPGRHYKVLVVSTQNPRIYGRSRYYFRIIKGTVGGHIHVEQPSATGISWEKGTKHLISWTDNLYERVNIKLVNYETHPYDTTNIASNRKGSTYIWRIPSTLATGSHYKVLVMSSVNPSLYDRSDYYFKIIEGTVGGTIHVEQPNAAGLQWVVGSHHVISWTDNLSERVNLYLINYESHPYDTTLIASNRSGSTYDWHISSSQTTGSHFKVFIVSTKNASVNDRSDHYFSIVKGTPGGTITISQPSNAGISITQGSKYMIVWDDNLTEKVNIRLINYGVHPYDTTVITNNRSGTTYTWHVGIHQTTGTHFKVMVVSSVTPSVYARSAHYFSIVAPSPQIEVYPNPSTTHVTLKFNEKDNETYQVALYNRYNLRIMKRQVDAANMKLLRINTFELPNGIYFLRMTSPKGVISKKIIVQH
jgi:predicted HNH restriction endonuclease